MQKNSLIVKEPEEMLLMKGDFSESALKLGAYLIAILEKNKVIYKINIKEYLTKFDKKIGNYNYLYNVTKELSQKQFEMKDRFNEKFVIFNFISSATYADGVLEIEFSQKLLSYLLEIKDKYLKYNIKNIMSLSSKYAIRLYKLLKDNLEKNSRYGNKSELKLNVKELREILEVPKSYKYFDIKRQILNKAKVELEKHTDIIFDYEEIKTGRKVTHLKFEIKLNSKNAKNDNKQEDKHFKSLKNFVTLLREKYLGNKKFFGFKTIENKSYWLGLDNNGLIYAFSETGNKNFNANESQELYKLWFKIAQNSDLYRQLIREEICLRDLALRDASLWQTLTKEIIELKENRVI